MTPCGCSRAVAVLSGLFSGLAACIVLSESACRDAGGRVSDVAWICETASGASAPIWSMVSAGTLAVAVLAIGVPVAFVADALGRRAISACGLDKA